MLALCLMLLGTYYAQNYAGIIGRSLVRMELGLRKCAVAHVKRGKYISGEDCLLPEEWKIEQVSQGGTYNQYLRIEQVFQSDHKSVLYLVSAAEDDELLQAVLRHQLFLATNGEYSTLRTASSILQQYELCPYLVEIFQTGDEGMGELKAAQAVKLVSALTAKPIHKVYFEQASTAEGVDTEGTFGWLTDGRFRAETEGLVIAAQDGVILTNRYKHTVLRTSTTSLCRVCREGEETIGHIMSSCGPHKWSLYKERHDRVVYQLMMALAKWLEVIP